MPAGDPSAFYPLKIPQMRISGMLNLDHTGTGYG